MSELNLTRRGTQYITRSAMVRRINQKLAKNKQKLRYHKRSDLLHDPEFMPHFDVARIFGHSGNEPILRREKGSLVGGDNRSLERFGRKLGIHACVIPRDTCENCDVYRATSYEPDWDLSLCGECSRELHAIPEEHA